MGTLPQHRVTAGPGAKHLATKTQPPEAFSACEKKSKGDTCSLTFHDHTVEGTCAEPPPGVTDTRLACRPNGPGPPPSAR